MRDDNNYPRGILHMLKTREGAAKLIIALYESETPLTVAELREITQINDEELYHGTMIKLKNKGIIQSKGRDEENRHLKWTIGNDYKFKIERDLNLFKECIA